MKTKTKAWIMLMNEIHNNNNYLYSKFIMFKRFFYLFYIFISETIKFNFNNLIYLICKLPKLERLELLKSITNKLEDLNIVYVKIFQTLCLDKNILYTNEQEYLFKYLDSVPYKSEEVNYELLDIIESKYNIILEDNEVINSGIIGIVFKGIDRNNNNSKVVIKLLKNNIEEKLNTAFNEIESLAYIFSYIPYLKKLNLYKFCSDNKEILLNQLNFVKEVTNIEIFKFKLNNLPKYRIPYVYKAITNEYDNVIVMENIKGLTINDIDYDINLKENFGKLLFTFGYISILYNSAIHCDLHAGNIFFYINDENSGLPKYQMGLIDFGLCCFPDKNNQNYYYIFFNDFFNKKDFSNKEKLNSVVQSIIHEKEYYNNFSSTKKEKLLFLVHNCIEYYVDREFDLEFMVALNNVFKKYNLNFSYEFNQLCLSLNSCTSLGKKLCISITNTQKKCIEELIQINKLIEI